MEITRSLPDCEGGEATPLQKKTNEGYLLNGFIATFA